MIPTAEHRAGQALLDRLHTAPLWRLLLAVPVLLVLIALASAALAVAVFGLVGWRLLLYATTETTPATEPAARGAHTRYRTEEVPAT
ncbi:hypothetical protein [Streptomyces aidingensis]|uniref:hypothetical protein n=1 Tax=Streptomyces aidingensis TaxID=910347 RepID=UPI0015874FC8|nr:hypothetical protein [Streptomyces aidingensis]